MLTACLAIITMIRPVKHDTADSRSSVKLFAVYYSLELFKLTDTVEVSYTSEIIKPMASGLGQLDYSENVLQVAAWNNECLIQIRLREML